MIPTFEPLEGEELTETALAECTRLNEKLEAIRDLLADCDNGDMDEVTALAEISKRFGSVPDGMLV